MTGPCRDCSERYQACHDTCEPYKAWKAENERIKKAMAEDRAFTRAALPSSKKKRLDRMMRRNK